MESWISGRSNELDLCDLEGAFRVWDFLSVLFAKYVAKKKHRVWSQLPELRCPGDRCGCCCACPPGREFAL